MSRRQGKQQSPRGGPTACSRLDRQAGFERSRSRPTRGPCAQAAVTERHGSPLVSPKRSGLAQLPPRRSYRVIGATASRTSGCSLPGAGRSPLRRGCLRREGVTRRSRGSCRPSRGRNRTYHSFGEVGSVYARARPLAIGGSRSVNRAPPTGAGSHVIVPPCDSIVRRTIASPRPVPPRGLRGRRTNGSKIRSR